MRQTQPANKPGSNGTSARKQEGELAGSPARLGIGLRLRWPAADAPVAVHEHVAGEEDDDKDAQAEEDEGEVLCRLRAPRSNAPVSAPTS